MFDRILSAGHVWLTREDVDWVYVRINRCGSTWLTNYLKLNGFASGNPRELKNHHKLIVLREPLERLISGICSINGLAPKFAMQPRKTLNYLITDPHTKPQVEFLQDINLSNCTFIKYSPIWTENFFDFLNRKNTTMTVASEDAWFNKPGVEQENEFTYIDDNIKARFSLLQLIKDDQFLNKTVADYLEKDYKLYNSLEWYGTN